MTDKPKTMRDSLARRRGRLWRYVSPRRRRLWIAVLVLLLGATVAYAYLTSDGQIRALIESELTRRLGTAVTVDHASFSLFGPVQIDGVTVASTEAGRPPILTVKTAMIDHDPVTLLTGSFTPTRAIFVEPMARKVVDLVAGATSKPAPPGDRGERRIPMIDPFPIIIRGGRVRLIYTEGPRVVETRELAMDATLTPRADHAYGIHVRGAVNGGPVITVSATVSLAGAALEELALPVELVKGLAPADVRNGLADWRLGGAVKIVRRTGEAVGPGVYDIDLAGLTAGVPPSLIPLNVRNLAGHVIVDTVGERVTLEGVSCTLGELGPAARLAVSGNYDGFEPDSPCTMQVVATACRLPPRVGKGDIEEAVAFARRNYGLTGAFDVKVGYSRAAGKAGELRGRLELREGASARYAFFPYRLERMSGTIEFTDEQITRIDLKGRRGQAVVAVTGCVPDMTRDTLYDIRVTAEEIPLDDGLKHALDVSVGEFLWPSLKPRGTAKSAAVHVVRDKHTDSVNPRVHVAMDFDGRVGITHEAFPYGLDAIRGRVVVDDESVRIVTARGVHGKATCTVDGVVTKIDTRHPELDLTIQADRMVLDEDLLAAIGPDGAEAIRSLHAVGPVPSARVRITQGADRVVNYHVAADLAGLRIKPDVFPYELTDVAGTLDVTQDHVLLKGLTGRHGKARASVEGKIVMTGKVAAVERIVFTARDVTLEAALRAALPAEVREVWDDLSLAGTADIPRGVLRHTDTTKGGALDYDITVEPTAASVTYTDFPRPITGIRGRLRATPGQMTIDGVRAIDGKTILDLSGRIITGKRSGAELALSARAVPVDKHLIAAMAKVSPAGVKHIKPGGTISVKLDTLCLGALCDKSPPAAATGPAAKAAAPSPWSARGTVAFADMGMDVGLGSKTLSGRFVGSGAGRGDELEMDARLSLDEVLVDGRRITGVEGHLLKRRQGTVLEIRDFEARAHGGRLAGKASIGLDDPVTYAISLQVRGIKLAEMVPANGGKGAAEGTAPPAGAAGKKQEVKGLLSGRIEMLAVAGDPSKLRGAGEIHITEANISKLPVLLELLHLVQLQLPGGTSFTDADVAYRLAGRMLIFQEINLRSSVISFVGSGTLDLDTNKIRLVFVGNRLGKLPRLKDLFGDIGKQVFTGVAKQFVEIRTTGTLDDPKTQTIALPTLADFLRAARGLLKPPAIEREAPKPAPAGPSEVYRTKGSQGR